PVAGRVRAQLPPLPAVAGRVQHRRVLGGDDAVARVAGGERARGVVGGGQRHLFHAERGDTAGGLRVSVDVPGVDECRRLHLPSSSSAYPRSISSASCFTWSSVGSCSGERTSPTSSPRSRTPALTRETA